MTIKEMYIITTETSVIFPYFNESGRLMSMILEGDQLHIVDCKPIEIIDHNLRRAGSSLKGAYDGAAEILGSNSMSPVVISRAHGIYWTPIMSPKSPECIWFAVGHVKKYTENADNKVTVFLHNGSIVDLPISHYRFKERVQRACTLQYKIETNTRQVMKVKENYTQSYFLKKKDKGVNFEQD